MSNFEVPDLKIRPREGGYARGQEGFEMILRAALRLLVEQGSKALTLRRIAAECDLNVGNLNYYFKSKEELIRELIEAVIASYEESFDAILHDPDATAEGQLERIITLILTDITSQKTTRFFPELWAMSNYNAFIQDRMEELYTRARAWLNELIFKINPALPADERDTLALFISASMEGMTVFAGFQKPWRSRMPWLIAIAKRSFVDLVRDLKPGEMKAMNPFLGLEA